ncbi:MAG TPA: helix-turn-helix transcriptional regulator [Aggregatilineales bacterium]|nr:XRE family transcriptional regulator [Anaerolineales bacterium]HRE47712.1 helix-turn-helix transcriptional regulator [Aggregatilineales bacterium]
MGDFSDVSAKLKQKRAEKLGLIAPEDRNYAELHLVRARILGVLLRDARIAGGKTVAEMAETLKVAEGTVSAWEFGELSPSLPQLEVIAYVFDIPVSHFWNNEISSTAGQKPPVPMEDYSTIRDRVIGARLQLARQEARLSHAELAVLSGVSPDHIAYYETGAASIPFPELTSLANGVKRSVSDFLEGSGRVGAWLRMQEQYDRFQDLPEELRTFVSQRKNQPYLEIALRLSKLDNSALRTIAESILDITL